jgi:hypothetical protein
MDNLTFNEQKKIWQAITKKFPQAGIELGLLGTDKTEACRLATTPPNGFLKLT